MKAAARDEPAYQGARLVWIPFRREGGSLLDPVAGLALREACLARVMTAVPRVLRPETVSRGILLLLLAGALGLSASTSPASPARAGRSTGPAPPSRRTSRAGTCGGWPASSRPPIARCWPRTDVRITALDCGPSVLGGMTCRARYLVNGQGAGLEGGDRYFRIGFSLLSGWESASVAETSGLRYSLAPGRCSLTSGGR